MAAELRINHTNRTARNVASLLDDDLTSDVVFVISEEVGADTRGSSHATTLQRLDADVGTGKAGRSPAVVLEADFGGVSTASPTAQLDRPGAALVVRDASDSTACACRRMRAATAARTRTPFSPWGARAAAPRRLPATTPRRCAPTPRSASPSRPQPSCDHAQYVPPQCGVRRGSISDRLLVVFAGVQGPPLPFRSFFRFLSAGALPADLDGGVRAARVEGAALAGGVGGRVRGHPAVHLHGAGRGDHRRRGRGHRRVCRPRAGRAAAGGDLVHDLLALDGERLHGVDVGGRVREAA